MAIQTKKTTAAGRQREFRLDDEQSAWIFERLVVGLLLLGIAGCAAYLFLGVMGLVDLSFWTPLGATMEQHMGLKNDTMHSNHIAWGVGSLLVGLAATGMLLRRRGSSGGADQRHILAADERGMVMVETRGVSAVAVAAVKRTPGVVDARVKVQGKGDAPVRLKVTVWASAAAELKEVGQQARQNAAEAVEQLVGIAVHDVLVKVQVVPLADVGRMLE